MQKDICTDNYISDTIFIRDYKLYQSKNNKIIKVTDNNWHKLLEDYGWQKLHLNWIKRLNKSVRLSEIKNMKKQKRQNSKFGILDCGGSGDCFFSCVVESLNSEREVYDNYDVKILRELLANSITSETFKLMIENYRILKDIGEFYDEWDPYSVLSEEDLKTELKKEGSNFMADHMILQLFHNLFLINIIILNSTQYKSQIDNTNNLFKLYNTGISYNKDLKTIILSYEDSEHFRLIGHLQNNNMIILFNDNTLPKEIINIIHEDLIRV